jgi:hypothetical protein
MIASSGGSNRELLAGGLASAPADPDWAVGPPPDITPPETEISKRPRNRSARRKAAHRFTASEPASFECRRDRRDWVPCQSPIRWKRLDLGRHRFRVRATDLAGNADPSAAVDRFRVVRRGRSN